jgi:beta-lactamase regulating signal transducer with metallopeptidase domain
MNTWKSLSIPMEAQMFALQVAISGAVVSGLVLLAARLLRRRSAPLRYGVLLAGVFGLLAVPALVGVGLNVPLLPAGEEIVKISAEMLPAFLDRPPLEAPPVVEDSSSIGDTVGTLLLIVWTGFAVLGLMRLLFGLGKQRRAIIGQTWSAAWWTDERRACLAEKVGLRRFPAVHCSPVAPMPMVVGLLRPKIVLPEQAPSTWGQEQWEAVLLHEAAHIARRDPWSALAQCLAVILFWWCPLVHLMARRLNDLREAICDDYALEGPCDRIAYAELLVESAERLVNLRALPVPVGLIDSARGGLEERITRLLAKEKEPMKKLSLAGKLLGASFLVAACLSITAATAFTQTPPAKKIQIKIIIDGKEIDLDAANLAALLQAVQPKAEAAPKFNVVIDPSQLKFKVHVDGGQRVTLPTADPRIEELVKQAEAIKPGSGQDIRRALAAAPKPLYHFDDTVAKIAIDPTGKMLHAEAGSGKHVIVLTIDAATGKVVQLQGADLKKFLEKPAPGGTIEMHFKKPADPKAVEREKAWLERLMKLLQANEAVPDLRFSVADEVAKGLQALGKTAKGPMPSLAERERKAAEDALRYAEAQKAMAEANRVQALKALGATKKGPAAPAQPAVPPTTQSAPKTPASPPRYSDRAPANAHDVEALARQLERISAELQELRKRLDANKK